jgi:NADP-dependent 3-hydroxy acid dehydrogenase YdfG
VLVVGASSGIGRSCAILFAREGCRVSACARRNDRLQKLRSDLAADGLPIDVHTADAIKMDDMQRVAKESGEVDILIYATGTNTPDRAMTRLTPEIWNELITTNLNGAYYATRAVLPAMRNKKAGHLIYIASISGLVPDVSGAAYQASKRGLVGLAHAIRVEEKENGIRTCAICPGLVETEILEKRPVKPSPEQLAKALQPDDVAEVTLAIAKLPPRAAVPEIQLMPTYL